MAKKPWETRGPRGLTFQQCEARAMDMVGPILRRYPSGGYTFKYPLGGSAVFSRPAPYPHILKRRSGELLRCALLAFGVPSHLINEMVVGRSGSWRVAFRRYAGKFVVRADSIQSAVRPVVVCRLRASDPGDVAEVLALVRKAVDAGVSFIPDAKLRRAELALGRIKGVYAL